MHTTRSQDVVHETIAANGSQWAQYRAEHGELALTTWLFMAAEGQGFPVMVKSQTSNVVTLMILQTLFEFDVSMAQFRQYQGSPFLLDRGLETREPAAFRRQANWFRAAYRYLGISVGVGPKL